jgi:predicted RNase H-like HicB family nuclease
MKTYFALVHHEEDSAFGVEFPDLPGVFSASDTETDLIANAVEALQLAADDATLAPPSGASALMARDDVRAALAQGAFLVSVPLIENETTVQRVNVTFERGLLRAIDQTARGRKITRAGFLAQAARNEIEHRR